jgi:hypothetical protein
MFGLIRTGYYRKTSNEIAHHYINLFDLNGFEKGVSSYSFRGYESTGSHSTSDGGR